MIASAMSQTVVKPESGSEEALFTGVFLFLFLGLLILSVAAVWRVFTKAGKPGWACLVPVYNSIVFLRIIGRPVWWFVLLHLPIVNLFFFLVVSVDLAKSFGRGGAFGLGLAVLGVVFAPILAFGRAEYKGPRPEPPFLICLWLLGGIFLFLTVALILAQVWYAFKPEVPIGEEGEEIPGIWATLTSREILHAIWLSLWTSTAAALLSLLVAVPLGYVMSRTEFAGKNLVDAIIDVPIMLPPLVVGLGLLILFRIPPFVFLEDYVTYQKPSIVLAQFAVAGSFAIRTMRITFDQLNPRSEQVAMTLGCTRHQAFWRVVLPEAWPGMLAAFTLAWARSLGEFGPVLVFSGATRMKTEVLSTSVFLELSVGNLKAALAVSVLMIVIALLALLVLRMFGSSQAVARAVRV